MFFFFEFWDQSGINIHGIQSLRKHFRSLSFIKNFIKNLNSEIAFPFSSSCYLFLKQAITTWTKFHCVSIIYRTSLLKKQQKLQRCTIKLSTTSTESIIAFNETLFLNARSHSGLLFCLENFTGAFFGYYNNMFYIWSQTKLFQYEIWIEVTIKCSSYLILEVSDHFTLPFHFSLQKVNLQF